MPAHNEILLRSLTCSINSELLVVVGSRCTASLMYFDRDITQLVLIVSTTSKTIGT